MHIYMNELYGDKLYISRKTYKSFLFFVLLFSAELEQSGVSFTADMYCVDASASDSDDAGFVGTT